MSRALVIKNLTKTYANGFQALKGIDLNVEEGDFYGLLGPNGAGKSTTIGIICSLVNKTGGQVKIFDYDIDTHFSEAKRNIGVVPQELNFSQFEKVLDIVVNQAGYYGIPRKLAIERAEYYLEKLGLWEKRNQPSRALSGGMKRRLMIVRALLHEPRLLILDEPTAGVDIELRRSLWEFLREINAKGKTIILTTHYLEEAETLCKNIGIIDKGMLVENAPTRTIIQKLNTETFILDMPQPLLIAPVINGFTCTLDGEGHLEVIVKRGQSLNDVFSACSAQGLQVISMRNKTNRLEEMFVSLVKPTLVE